MFTESKRMNKKSQEGEHTITQHIHYAKSHACRLLLYIESGRLYCRFTLCRGLSFVSNRFFVVVFYQLLHHEVRTSSDTSFESAALIKAVHFARHG